MTAYLKRPIPRLSFTFPKEIRTRLKDLYRRADHLFEKWEKKSTCRKGCSNCCKLFRWHIMETINVIKEFPNALKNKEFLSIFQQKLFKYNDIHEKDKNGESFNNRNLDIYDFLHSMDNKYPCIFLTEENTCAIYKARPLMCRLYMGFDPEKCTEPESILSWPEEYRNAHDIMLLELFKVGEDFIKLCSKSIKYFRNLIGKNPINYPFRFIFVDLNNLDVYLLFPENGGVRLYNIK